ncbi:MAG: hypothetical protein GY820_20860 [Gammaproteobacteria bacterium]|nr:hypothetical protein [Gammaproteobacteria bacterium]
MQTHTHAVKAEILHQRRSLAVRRGERRLIFKCKRTACEETQLRLVLPMVAAAAAAAAAQPLSREMCIYVKKHALHTVHACVRETERKIVALKQRLIS